jgi:hypothetical protein
VQFPTTEASKEPQSFNPTQALFLSDFLLSQYVPDHDRTTDWYKLSVGMLVKNKSEITVLRSMRNSSAQHEELIRAD